MNKFSFLNGVSNRETSFRLQVGNTNILLAEVFNVGEKFFIRVVSLEDGVQILVVGLSTGPLGIIFNISVCFPHFRVTRVFRLLVPSLLFTQKSFSFCVDPRLMLSSAGGFGWHIAFNYTLYFLFNKIPKI